MYLRSGKRVWLPNEKIGFDYDNINTLECPFWFHNCKGLYNEEEIMIILQYCIKKNWGVHAGKKGYLIVIEASDVINVFAIYVLTYSTLITHL